MQRTKSYTSAYKSESDGSAFDWDENPKSNIRRKNILVESHCLNSSYSTQHTANSVLNLKYKVAQCMLIINRKDQYISTLKETLAKCYENLNFYESKNKQLEIQLHYRNYDNLEDKAGLKSLGEQNRTLREQIEGERFEKELMARQVAYYQAQIYELKGNIKEMEQNMENVQNRVKKELKFCKNLQVENYRLETDIKRLKILLSETYKYKKFAYSIDKKHYVGSKNCRSVDEKYNWVSYNIIHNVENLVKTNKYKNKDMISSMASFIEQYSQRIIKKTENKVKKVYMSKMKDIERKHNYSLNFMESTKRCSQKYQKQYKSRKNTEITELSVNEKFSRAFPIAYNGGFELCVRILEELRNRLCKYLNIKDNKDNKGGSTATINILIDWAIEAISNNSGKEKNVREKTFVKSVCSSEPMKMN